jgi:hypothetical protein
MTFSRALIAGSVPEGLLHAERRPPPPGLTDPWGRVTVDAIVEFGLRALPGDGPLLIVTDADLTMRECQWLFGFADRARGVVVISIRRLAGPGEAHLLKARLENEIAHEAGHLRGLGHCRHKTCVMRPVDDARELDARPLSPCGKCPSGSWTARLRLAAASLFLIAIVASLNLLMPLAAGPPFEMPFT